MYHLFPNVNFIEEGDSKDLFHDASQDANDSLV